MGDSIIPSMNVEIAIDWQAGNGVVRDYPLELIPKAVSQISKIRR